MRYVHEYHSPLGDIILFSDGEALVESHFAGSKYSTSIRSTDKVDGTLPIFKQTREWLDHYFRGENPGSPPALRLKGSPFRVAVWHILRSIPYGETTTYGDIANQIAKRKQLPKMSAQAVGGAVGHNPVGIIVPCHRVIGSNGNLTGYAGGLDKKLALLKLERIDTSNMFMPKNS